METKPLKPISSLLRYLRLQKLYKQLDTAVPKLGKIIQRFQSFRRAFSMMRHHKGL
jgi:hypothetical protein